jgi:hypothetical protein
MIDCDAAQMPGSEPTRILAYSNGVHSVMTLFCSDGHCFEVIGQLDTIPASRYIATRRQPLCRSHTKVMLYVI